MKLELEDFPPQLEPEVPPSGLAQPGELDLFPLLLLLRAKLGRTLLFALIGLLAAGVYAYTRKPRYASTASILIPQQANPSAASQTLQAATGLDLFGGGFEVYLDMLHSRTLEDKLIGQFHLERHYGVNGIEAAESTLFGRTLASASKEGLLLVTVQDEDPRMAADLANAYFSELSQLNASLGITAAGQLRRYYEGQMVREKDALAEAEVALEQSQQKAGVLEPTTQANAQLGAEESTRAQLRASQIQLQGLLEGATAENPQVVRLKSQIAALESQLNAFETGGGLAEGTPAARQPQEALNYIRKEREVKFHETLLAMITQQYESARQQESKDISMLEVLDTARPSPSPYWPKKRLWLMVGAAIGLVLGLLLTAIEGAWGVAMSHPANRWRMRQLVRGRATP